MDEVIKFTVEKHGARSYRITACSILDKYRKYNTGIIVDIDMLFDCMAEITRDLGDKVLFDTFDFTDKGR